MPRFLEQVFDKLELESRWLRIHRLEIDLGILPERDWEQVFIDRCTEQLRQALEKNKLSALTPQPSELFSDTQTQANLVSEQALVLESFFTFLSSGHHSLAKAFRVFSQFEKDIIRAIRESILSQHDLRTQWNAFTHKNRQAKKRLSKQFSLSFFREFIQLYWGISPTNWDSFTNAFEGIIREKESTTNPTKDTLHCWLTMVILDVLGAYVGPIDHDQVQSLCVKEWQKIIVGEEKKFNQTKIDRKQNLRENGDESTTHFLSETCIENSGLILAAPFLPMLFQELEWTRNQVFIDERKQEKAIQLSQFLVTGEDQSPEYLLTLNKLLCGWPMPQPLTRKIEISAGEKKEAERMLQAIITHWGKIGNSSIAGLRETFLQREGSLRFRKKFGDWHLHVEQKSGIDLLVERIPWTISMIKLPWMTERIQVDWV